MNFLGAQNAKNNAAKKPCPVNSNENSQRDIKTVQDSMNFLGAMGCAQVNMDNLRYKNVKNSVESFLCNPEFAQSHVAFCDGLVGSGLPLERAILATDKTFKILSDEKTYN